MVPSNHTYPPEAGVPEAGQVIAGKYQVERTLGLGGMGVVVAARHLHLGQVVAIKLLRKNEAGDATAVARFVQEARAVAALRSEHVARLMDVGTHEHGIPFLVMEHLEGTTLAAVRLQRGGRLSPTEAVDYLLQACDAVAEAHALGIVHRDLKPANLFLTRRHDGSTLVKVLDFGISKVMSPLERAPGADGLTETGMIVGSPEYVSPEQVKSSRRVDTRSDIWSLGVILYQMVTGELPFRGGSVGGMFVAISRDPPEPFPTGRDSAFAGPSVGESAALEGLKPVILRCLEKEPDARYQTVGELAAALLRFAPPATRAVAERIARPPGAHGSPEIHVEPPTLVLEDPALAGRAMAEAQRRRDAAPRNEDGIPTTALPTPPGISASISVGRDPSISSSVARTAVRPSRRTAAIAGSALVVGGVAALLLVGVTGDGALRGGHAIEAAPFVIPVLPGFAAPPSSAAASVSAAAAGSRPGMPARVPGARTAAPRDDLSDLLNPIPKEPGSEGPRNVGRGAETAPAQDPSMPQRVTK